MLAITVATPFYGCGGRNDDVVIGNGGKANSGGYTSGGVSLGGFWSTNGGTSAGGSNAGASTGGRSAGGAAGMGTEPPAPGKGGSHSEGGAAEGGEGGAPVKPPEPPQIECPSTAPIDEDSCDTAGRCSYVGSRCECMVNAKGGEWKCRESSEACPATAPTAGAECENPEDGAALECFYAAGLECRCMKDAWKCTSPPKPGEEPPKPGGHGAGGAPAMPPGPEDGGAPPMMPPPKPAEAGAGNN